MPTDAENRQRMAAAGAGQSSVLIPKIPYIPAPSDPRQMPQWYERWHREMEAWREKVNQALTPGASTVRSS